MRRRLALLMATVLCVTSVPQVRLIGMAAEETAPETELVGSTEDATGIGLQSAENPEETAEIQSAETEAVAVQETLAAETETAMAETAQATEAATEETQPAEVPQEPQTETETPEATEAPQETETTAMTETAAPETEAPAETETKAQETEKTTEPEVAVEEATETENEIVLSEEEGCKVVDLELECSSPLYYILEDTSQGQTIQSKSFWLNIIYENDQTAYGYSAWYSNTDNQKNEISRRIYREDGTEIPYTDSLEINSMGAGSYYFEITCGGKTVRQNFKIVSMEDLKDSAVELQMGSNTVTAGYDNFYLYHFRTENDTQITFQGDKKGDLHLLYRETENGYVSWGTQGTADSVLGMKIYGNHDYYFYSCSNSKEDVSTELTLMEQPAITEVVKVSGQDEFLEKLDSVYTQGLTVEVSYANQPSQFVKMDGSNGTDGYGNTIVCKVVDKDGRETSVYQLLPIGDYTLVLSDYNTGKILLETPIHVVDPKENAEELKIGQTTSVTLEYNQSKYFRFTPKNDYFLYTVDVKKQGEYFNSSVYLYDEDCNRTSYFYGDTELEKGKTYYIGITSNVEGTADASIEIQARKKLESITVIPGSTKYLENNYSEHFADWKFKMNYSDGTASEELKLGEPDTYGYSAKLGTVKKGTEVRWDYSYAEAGEYTVTFEYNDVYPGISTEEYTFYQVPLMEYIAYAGTPLELGKEETVPGSQSNYFYYQVPEGADGYYNLYFGEGYGSLEVYKDNGDQVPQVEAYFGNYQSVYYLEASQKYLFRAANYYSQDMALIFRKVPVWNMEEPLSVNEDAVYLAVPGKTGKYQFLATDQVTGDEWKKESYVVNIADTDGENPSWGRLTAGKQYLLNVKSIYDEETTNPCTVTAEFIVTLDSIDVSVDNSNTTELVEYLSEVNFDDEAFKIMAHYSDGTTEEIVPDEDGDRIDSQNNWYYLSLKKSETYIRNSRNLSAGTYTLEVKSSDRDMEIITGSGEFTIKSIKEVAEAYGVSLTFGTAQKLKKEESQPAAYYSFTPETTGRYEFEFSDLIDRLVGTDENGQKLAGMTVAEKGYQFSLTEGQTYYFAVVGGSSENTVSVTKSVDVEKVDLQIENADSYIGGIDQLETKNVELKITYDNSETATIHGGEKDAYGNYFRLKASIGKECDYKLRTGSALSLYAGNYTVSASLRNEEESIAQTELSVKELNLEEQPEVKAGEVFTVNGGREFFRITPETDGKYYAEQAPYGSSLTFKQKSDLAWRIISPSEALRTGETYLVQYEGNAGKALIGTVPEITKIALESTEKPVEYLDYSSKYLGETALIITYAGGRKEKVYDQDSYGNEYERELRDSENDEVGYGTKLWAGTYSLIVSGGGINLSQNIEVQSIKAQAQNQVVTSETQTTVEKGEDQHAVFFAYQAADKGRQELTVSNRVNDLAAVDEDGKQIVVTKTGEGHYTFSLNAGATAYFAVDTDSTAVMVTLKSTVNLKTASLKTKKTTYYEDLDNFSATDLQVMAEYTNDTMQTVEQEEWDEAFCDSYGNNFHFAIETPNGQHMVLSGSSISLSRGEYRIDAYLNEEAEVLTSTTVQTQEIKLDELPEIYAEKTFALKESEDKELFQFTPEETGSYELKEKDMGTVSFREYRNNTWCWVDTLKKGSTYLVVFEDGSVGDVTLVKKTSGGDITTSAGGVLELDKSYDVSIGKSGDKVTFTFVPEEDGTYCLERADENEFVPYFELYENLKKVGGETYALGYDMKAGVKYTFKVSEANGNIGTYKIVLTKQETVDQKPKEIKLMLWSDEAEDLSAPAILGVQGIHTPESILNGLELFIRYGDSSGAYWSGLKFGEETDTYGNIYQISLTEETEAENGREYVISVSCGELKTAVKLLLLSQDSLDQISLDEEKNVNLDEAGLARQKYYRFTPEKTGYYAPSVSGEANSYWQIEDMAGNRVSYNENQKGYYLKTGETYYFCLGWYADGSGSVTVTVKKSNPLKNIKLVQEPSNPYCVYSLVPARPEGAVLELTYADGTTKQLGYDETDTDGTGIGCTGRFTDSKTYVLTYEYCGFYAEYEVPATAPETLPLLTEKQNAEAAFDGNLNWERRAFRVQVEKDGEYRVNVYDVNDWMSILYDSSLYEISGEENAYELEAGQTYYLVVKADCEAAKTVQISLKSTEEICEHDFIWVVDQEPTCVKAGSRHKECRLCHEPAGITESIPATGKHDYEWKVDKEATCGAAGSQHEECTVCHVETASTVIPATGNHSYKTIVDEPATCGDEGIQHEECVVCHAETESTVIPATGKHNYKTIVDEPATCGDEGIQHEECIVCHDEKDETIIPATGKHNYKTIIDEPATCGETGIQHKECTVCHDEKDETTIPATGKHTYGAYKTVKAATVFATGKEERSCTVCGNKQSRTIKKLTAKISVAAKSTSVVVGSRVTAPKVTYANGDRIASWKTSNKAVATVDKYGRITGKKAGTAIITVTLKSKKYARIKVTVKKKVTAVYVKLNRTSLTLKRGRTFQLRTTVTPRNTTDTVTYKTSNKNIVSVTSKGKLVAKKKGRATITVTVGRKKAYCRVVVK